MKSLLHLPHCHKILPLVYDESLSYYEVLCKVITNINTNSENISILDESLTYLKEHLPYFMYNVICVNDWGAMGDGETDDTEAIQRCFTNCPNSVILFKAGNYIISDEIMLYGNQGGQTIIFGGAYFEWRGGMAQTKSMFKIDAVTDEESRCRIIGGTINGRDYLGCAIENLRYHTVIDGVKVYDVTDTAIKIGDSGGGRSLQTICKDLYLFMSSHTGQGWSNVNNVKGISIYEPDNMFMGVNCLRLRHAIYMESQGNEFSECHFTASFEEPVVDDNVICSGVCMNPLSSSSISCNTFTNIYFDNVKYCFYYMKNSRVVNSVFNSKYFNSGANYTGLFRAFMQGGSGYGEVIADGFTVVPVGGRCQFFDSFFSNANFQFKVLNHQYFTKTIYSLNEGYRVDYIASHNANNGEYVPVMRGNDVTEGTLFSVGSIVCSANRGGYVKLHLMNREYGDATVTVSVNASRVRVHEIDEIAKLASFSLLFSAPVQFTLNGGTYYQYKMYVKPKVDFTETYLVMSADAPNFIGVYLNGDIPSEIIPSTDYDIANYTVVDIDEPPTIKNNYHNLATIGVTTADTITEALTKLPRGTNVYTVLRNTISGTNLYNSLPLNFDYVYVHMYKDNGTNTGICELIGQYNQEMHSYIGGNGSNGQATVTFTKL